MTLGKSTGVLNLIDLAGSENCKSSGVDGIALDECKQINSSLSALSGVFKAMAENSNHIPYRDSMLTQLLKNYLNKDTKALMIVNVSPCVKNYPQTLNALKFAKSVNMTKL